MYKRGKDMQKRRSKMTVQDMREIAHFHRICLNYIKMKRIEERSHAEDAEYHPDSGRRKLSKFVITT